MMLVNCSERKKPPTRSTKTIKAIGVATVNAAQAARKAELMIAFATRMLRKPNHRRIDAVAHFIPIAPRALANVIMPDSKGVIPNPI